MVLIICLIPTSQTFIPTISKIIFVNYQAQIISEWTQKQVRVKKTALNNNIQKCRRK